jgi:hypothetical protein
MISEADYVGPWYKSQDWTEKRQDNADKLLDSVSRLMIMAMDDGVNFPVNPATHSQVSGKTYGGFRPQSCPQGAPHSNHKEGLAVDIFDPLNKIDEWCMSNLDKLEECGIWIEHPDATEHWSHWQCVPPKSGKRVFHP